MQMIMGHKLLGLFFLWGILSGIFVAGLEADSFIYIRWLVLALFYWGARLSANRFPILAVIVLVGVVQAAVAIGQQVGWMESNHPMFPVTGLLGNPGQLGGFQAVALVVAVALFMERTDRYVRLLLLFSSFVLAYTVALADSRAAWIASLLGMAALFHAQVMRIVKHCKRWAVPLVATAVVVLSVITFNYRSESAKGRMLIWRVCADMICDKSLVGHGLSSFNKHYMHYQAAYFERHPHSEFAKVADNAAYPYNEFLHCWIELGAVGLLFFVVALVLTMYAAERKIRAPLVALLAFSMFSYPVFVNALLVLFPVLLGLSAPRRTRRWGNVVAAGMLAVALLLGYLEYNFIKEAGKILQKEIVAADDRTEQYVGRNFHRIAEYPRLNMLYAQVLVNRPELASSEKIGLVLPTCENWCDIGELYLNRDSLNAAERYYVEASYMVPTRMRPKYLLFKLYCRTGRMRNAAETAREILEMSLKMENSYTLKRKVEVREFLKTYKP